MSSGSSDVKIVKMEEGIPRLLLSVIYMIAFHCLCIMVSRAAIMWRARHNKSCFVQGMLFITVFEITR